METGYIVIEYQSGFSTVRIGARGPTLALFSIGCIEAVGDKGLCNIPAMTIGVSRAQYDLYSGVGPKNFGD